MWSQRTHYAIRALTALAGHQGATLSARRIADEEDIPPKYLEVVLGELRDSGLVHSTKGKSGGYRLTHDPSTVRLATIVETVDPSFVAGFEQRGSAPSTPILSDLGRRVWEELTVTTLADALRARQRRADAIDYAI